MENLLNIGGSLFRVNLKALDKLLILNEEVNPKENIEETTTTDYDANGEILNTQTIVRKSNRGKEIDGPKFEMIRFFFDILSTHHEELDDSLGFDRAMQTASMTVKISFNTLVSYGIIEEIIE